ncbi:MAG TPA: serine hydrolase [Hymenobacter sp.]
MKKLFTLLFVLFTLKATAQTGILVPQLASCDSTIQKFVKRWDMLGASVAIARNGKLMYARSFGYADLNRTTPLQPYHLLRVASLSKSVTSLAIMKLVEQSQLDLSHKVFGPTGYLGGAYYTSVISDPRLYDITVQHLLEHTAGWDRSVGCDGFANCDPITFPLHVTKAMKASDPVADSTLVRFMLAKGLDFAPGTEYAYSNVGYLILGKLVEAATGQQYEDWVREHLLQPSGVLEAHLGRNLLKDRQERESQYRSTGRMASCYGTGQQVSRAYGGFNVEAMNAHGGWIFSARDLVRLVLSADGFETRPDLLAPATIKTMAQASTVNPGYAKGWEVGRNGWWHSGYLDGSVSYLVRTNTGYTWAILMNSSNNPGPQFWSELDKLGWTCVRGVTTWPEHDLFAPEQNASQLTTTILDSTSEQLHWINGNGTRQLVLLKADSPVNTFPQDGVSYEANAAFGQGTDLGDSTFVVANAEGNTALLTGLDPRRTYYARVVEYHQNATTDNQPVYALEGNPTLTLHGGIVYAAKEPDLMVYPNPTASELSIKNLDFSLSYDVVNDQGVAIQSGVLEPGSTIGVASLTPGLYLLRMHTEDKEVVRRFIKE